MGVLKGFEQLAHELPEDERNELLNELKDELRAYSNTRNPDAADKISAAELPPAENEEGSIKDPKYLEKIYRKIPLVDKIMVVFRKLFTGKSIEQIVEDYILKKLGKEIESSFPGLIDAKNSRLKERFYSEISIFAGSIDVFSQPVNYINKAGPALFYRYAAAREMSGFEEHLKQNTNPDSIYASGSIKNYEDLKLEINVKYNEIMDSVDADEKKNMYGLARSLFYITQLVLYPYELLKKKFVIDASGYRSCQFAGARKLLGQLDTIITSMTSEINDYQLFCDYLFDFYLTGNETVTDSSGTDEYPAKAKKKAMEAVSQIYSLKKTIPFKKILKLIYKNTDYKPGSISGGEEWFAIYKQLLKDELDEITENFIFRQKKKSVVAKLKAFIPDMPVTEKYYFIFRLGSKAFPLKKCNLLYYLYIFYQKYYTKIIEKTASVIMLDGNFYKDSNKKELSEAFNHINSFSEAYQEYVSKIGIDNQSDNEAFAYTQEKHSIGGKKTKKENMARVLSKEGYRLYKSYYDAFISIKNILGGVATGNASGKYDTLSNLSVVCEEKTSMSVIAIDKMYRQLSEILNIFKEYDELEIDEYE
ncbi:MAG: hypothetical protein H7A26_00425 [Spirochaetales bacterium]|nr:hypothetical protein [Spirochaetales bacterium]